MRLIAAFFCVALSAQVARQANSGYKTETGRQNVGRTLGAEDRDQRQKPRELVASMELKPGMTVTDLGTGVGYMLSHLSAAVGPAGKVIAQDIFPDFLSRAKERAASAKLSNVEFVQGTDKDPNLPAGASDVILALDVYHHLDYPEQTLAALKKALRPGGRLIIVEYHKNKESMPNGRALEHVRLGEEDAIQEIEANGFRLVSHRDHVLRVQWMAVFVVK